MPWGGKGEVGSSGCILAPSAAPALVKGWGILETHSELLFWDLYLLDEQGTCLKTVLVAWSVTGLKGKCVPVSAVCVALTDLAHHEMLFM